MRTWSRTPRRSCPKSRRCFSRPAFWRSRSASGSWLLQAWPTCFRSALACWKRPLHPMRDLTFTDLERLDAAAGETDIVLQMDEDLFRAFYDRTARSLWLYLSRLTGSRQAADDLFQETYYRFLRIDRAYASDAHRRNYLFRIATNL